MRAIRFQRIHISIASTLVRLPSVTRHGFQLSRSHKMSTGATDANNHKGFILPDVTLTQPQRNTDNQNSTATIKQTSRPGLSRDIEDLHQQACDNGDMTYIDPPTGYTVLTELAHKKRGSCCGNACRHCPFDHCNVKNKSLRKFKK